MAKMERASYQLIIAKYQKRGKGNVRLTQSSLVLMQAIQTNTKTYNFAVLQSDNQSAIQPEEVRLNLNDEFVSYEVQYLLQAKSRVAGSTGGDYNTYLTYAPVELNAQLAQLNAAYDAKMTIDVNGVKRLENWDMLKHKCTPRTQYQNTSAGLPFATTPSICLNEDGTANMQPMLTFTGAKKNEISLTMSQNLSSGLIYDFLTVGGTITNEVKNLVLIFRGMLGQNAAVFQK